MFYADLGEGNTDEKSGVLCGRFLDTLNILVITKKMSSTFNLGCSEG